MPSQKMKGKVHDSLHIIFFFYMYVTHAVWCYLMYNDSTFSDKHFFSAWQDVLLMLLFSKILLPFAVSPRELPIDSRLLKNALHL